MRGERGLTTPHILLDGSTPASKILASVNQAANTTQHAALALLGPSRAWRRANNALSKSRKGQTLKPDFAVTAQGGEKQSLAPEKHRLEISGALDVVFNSRRKRDKTPCIDSERFSRQFFLNDRTSCVKECLPVSFQLLQNEALPTKKAGPQLAG